VTIQLAQLYVRLLQEDGHEAQLFDLAEVPVEAISGSAYGDSTQEFNSIVERYIRNASHIVYVVPEYNGSFPGILKYFMDACEHRDLEGKRCALVGLASGRGGNLRGVDHLTGILHYLGADVVAKKVYVSQVKQLLATDLGLKQPQTMAELRAQSASLLRY
jgi:NAD(P)H-dependent FMN reductase